MARITPFENALIVPGTVAGILTTNSQGVAIAQKGHKDARSAAQGNYRQRLNALNNVTKKAGAVARDFLMNVSPQRRWHQWFVKIALGPSDINWIVIAQTFNFLSPSAQALWQAEAEASNLRSTHLTYASDPAISAGLKLFEFCTSLEAADPPFPRTTPNANNSAYWGEYYRANE
jgi:hypothetical protein